MATEKHFPVNVYFCFCPLFYGRFCTVEVADSDGAPLCSFRHNVWYVTRRMAAPSVLAPQPTAPADRQRWSSDLWTWHDIGTPPVPRVWFRNTRREGEEEEEVVGLPVLQRHAASVQLSRKTTAPHMNGIMWRGFCSLGLHRRPGEVNCS